MILVKKISHNLRYFIWVCTPLFKILATGLVGWRELKKCKKMFIHVTLLLIHKLNRQLADLYVREQMEGKKKHTLCRQVRKLCPTPIRLFLTLIKSIK